MRLLLLLACGFSFCSFSQSGYLTTTYSNSWDHWNVDLNGFDGDLYLTYSGDWQQWKLTVGADQYTISTVYTNDWEIWQLSDPGGATMELRTTYADHWDHWNTSSYKHIETAYTGHYDNWGCDAMNISTTYTGHWDNWTVGDLSAYTNLEKAAILFVPVFTSVWKNVPGVGPYGLGVEETAEAASPLFWPNPAMESIAFDGEHSIRISDMTGKVVLEAAAVSSVDVSALQPGTYVVSCEESLPQQLIVL